MRPTFRAAPRPSRRRGHLIRAAGAAVLLVALQPGASAGAAPVCQTTAWIPSAAEDLVSTVDAPTRTRELPDIALPARGVLANEVAITPDGKTAFVVLSGPNTVLPIDVATHALGTEIPVGDDPQSIAITPDGTTAFVTNFSANSVSTIDIATRTKDPADIAVGVGPQEVAVSPDGTQAWITNFTGDTVSTIDVATRTPNPADIAVGPGPTGLAFTPDGTTVFVTQRTSPFPDPDPTKNGRVTVIDVATRTPAPTDISGFEQPADVVITPDGTTAFVSNFGSDIVSTIDVASRTKNAGEIDVGTHPSNLAITPDGTTVYAANFDGGSVSTIEVDTRTAATPDVVVGGAPSGIAFTPCAVPPPTPTSTTTTTATQAAAATPVSAAGAYTG